MIELCGIFNVHVGIVEIDELLFHVGVAVLVLQEVEEGVLVGEGAQLLQEGLLAGSEEGVDGGVRFGVHSQRN